MFDLDGISVGVDRRGDRGDPRARQPRRHRRLDFGDPVDGRQPGRRELSDGNAANGEADVIVASFHAGAQAGAGSDATTNEVAKGGEFAEMADLDPDVDVIFNGHTHQTYAWDAPVPGGPGKTRPIIQTGSLRRQHRPGRLTVDATTGDVVALHRAERGPHHDPRRRPGRAYPRGRARSRPSSTRRWPTRPRSATCRSGEHDRRHHHVPSRDGSFVNGTWEAPLPHTEDRPSESTLGDLVANALRDGIPADQRQRRPRRRQPGRPARRPAVRRRHPSNPANTDGVITYAEANAVLPFVNNIWTGRPDRCRSSRRSSSSSGRPPGADAGASVPARSASPTTCRPPWTRPSPKGRASRR